MTSTLTNNGSLSDVTNTGQTGTLTNFINTKRNPAVSLQLPLSTVSTRTSTPGWFVRFKILSARRRCPYMTLEVVEPLLTDQAQTTARNLGAHGADAAIWFGDSNSNGRSGDAEHDLRRSGSCHRQMGGPRRRYPGEGRRDHRRGVRDQGHRPKTENSFRRHGRRHGHHFVIDGRETDTRRLDAAEPCGRDAQTRVRQRRQLRRRRLLGHEPPAPRAHELRSRQ